MHVLLIEPDKLQAQLYGQALRRAGHQVAHAVSAQTAVHEADVQLPDVVVLELQMPQHNGVEFLYEFRSYPEWLHVPVVLHTFIPERELVQAVTLRKELGVERILYKPTTTLAQLCAAVQTVSHRQLVPGTAAATGSFGVSPPGGERPELTGGETLNAVPKQPNSGRSSTGSGVVPKGPLAEAAPRVGLLRDPIMS